MDRLLVSRVFLVVGLLIGLIAWWTTFVHIGDPKYVLIEHPKIAPYHPWQHNLREVLGDLAAMIVFLTIFFGPARYRNDLTWLICLILMIGYYAGFWIGVPFIAELGAASWTSEAVHVGMAAFGLLSILIAKPVFKAEAQ